MRYENMNGINKMLDAFEEDSITELLDQNGFVKEAQERLVSSFTQA